MHDPAFHYCLDWLKDERGYTINKFGTNRDKQRVVEDNVNREYRGAQLWWENQLDNYWHRIKILGLDTPNGRQALAKFVSTALGMLTATVEVYGELPEPGVTSGENLDMLRKIAPYIERAT